ncbi:MAG: hypothetical protein DSZ04_02795 [Sulfurimonas sp.]|nr:MAG: hypothetical protein DSZ04_02795 [Sulfurimonas sp.]
MAMILKEFGSSKCLLYHYFKSKKR